MVGLVGVLGSLGICPGKEWPGLVLCASQLFSEQLYHWPQATSTTANEIVQVLIRVIGS